MKVRRVVELLYQTYDPEQEIMALWYGSENFEMKAGVWEKACEFFDQQNYPYAQDTRCNTPQQFVVLRLVLQTLP